MAEEQKQAQPTSLWKGFVSGGFGGMCLVAAGHPLDLIKVRLQTMNRYNSAWHCFKTTLKEDGPLGLYRGMVAPLSGVTPIFALNFWAYDAGCQYLVKSRGVSSIDGLSLMDIGLAGAVAAIPTTGIMAPGERIKCILQIQSSSSGPAKYGGPIDVVKDLYAQGGIRQIYKGSAATLVRDGAGSFFYFSVYEGIKRALSKDGGTLNPMAVVAGGGMAGIFNWAVAIPFDTVKSRIQTFPEGSFTGMADCARKLIAEQGFGALWKGLGPAMLRAFPANAACFLGREVCLKFLNYVAPNW